ncbi:LppX_LprAFG lipoprotein [Saccharomonospora azurea]|uniref:LppX_LprAFG lipoprotein n=1 Tax=Saccharomonospora azurea TaxID=40988 RepID=UPI003317BDC3
MLLRRFAQSLVVALVVSAPLSACAGNPDNTGPLPEAAGLVAAAADDLRELTDVAFELRVSGAIPGLPVREIEGVADRRDDSARGEVDVQLPDERVQYSFVLDDDVVRLTDSEGAVVDRPVPAEHAPSDLLDPDHGLRRLLTEATELRTETREELGDVETYRIGGELSHAAISALVPGVHDDVDVKFWIADRGDTLVRVWVQVPPQKKNEGAVQLELELREHNRTGSDPGRPAGEPADRP